MVVTAIALFLPNCFLWIETAAVTPLLGIVMFGMGLTLKPEDFLPVIRNPKDIVVGELAQFIIMPLVAWLLCQVLSLPQELALGVILVGCCPRGTAANVICYLAKGDIAISVSMTAVSTMLAPFYDTASGAAFGRRGHRGECFRHVSEHRAGGHPAYSGRLCRELLVQYIDGESHATAALGLNAFRYSHHRHSCFA